MKKVWKINVSGENGYSFAVAGELEDEAAAMYEAVECGLFNDERDARYATVEDITDDEDELNAFKDETVRV